MRARHRRRRPGRIRMVLGALLILLGVGLVAAQFVVPEAEIAMPQPVERAYGEAKIAVGGTVDSVREEVLGDLPTVKLGVKGGMKELDRCDGTFTEMSSYEHEGVPPVWAAHNNCSGDVLLPWKLGQRIRLNNGQVYQIVDIRVTKKTWATVDDLVGLGGQLALQSCFYGEDRMKFIGLAPVS